MKTEKSCGAVVFIRENSNIKFVIIRSIEGFYGFPKGHMEAGESEEETALREIKEETGMDVELMAGFRTTDSHPHVREGKLPVMKEMIYFLGESKSQMVLPQESEVSEIRLMCYDEAMDAFQFESSKRILTEAYEFLKQVMP